jgi:hypothetical protein
MRQSFRSTLFALAMILITVTTGFAAVPRDPRIPKEALRFEPTRVDIMKAGTNVPVMQKAEFPVELLPRIDLFVGAGRVYLSGTMPLSPTSLLTFAAKRNCEGCKYRKFVLARTQSLTNIAPSDVTWLVVDPQPDELYAQPAHFTVPGTYDIKVTVPYGVIDFVFTFAAVNVAPFDFYGYTCSEPSGVGVVIGINSLSNIATGSTVGVTIPDLSGTRTGSLNVDSSDPHHAETTIHLTTAEYTPIEDDLAVISVTFAGVTRSGEIYLSGTDELSPCDGSGYGG